MAGTALIAWTGAAMLAAAGAQPAGPHLQGEAYLDARSAPFETLADTVWTRTRTPLAGEGAGTSVQVAARLGPDWAGWRVEGGAESLADWRTRRLLTLSADGRTLTNASLYGETRRRLDTYVALSGAGAREEIAFGAAGTFHRIWLEAAMGIAATDDTLSFEDTPAGFDASFEDDRLFRADFGGEDGSWCEAAPLDGDAARSARGWLRHAAPVHPDVMTRLEAEPRFPCAFELTVYSPESPQGRRERWVMQTGPDGEPAEAAQADEPAQQASAPAAPPAGDAPPTLAELLAMFDEAGDEGVDAELVMRALSASNSTPSRPAASSPAPAPAASASTRRPVSSAATDGPLGLRLPGGVRGARLTLKGDEYLEAAGAAALAAVTGPAARAPDHADFYEAFERARSTGHLAEALLISVQETHHFGPCPEDSMVGGARLTCALVMDLSRSGIGDAQFERAAQGLDAALEGAHRVAVDSLSNFIDSGEYAAPAARLLTASALIGWGPEGLAARPDLDPAGLLLEAIETDPYAPEAYWRLGQRFMEAGSAETAWTLFDLGRSLPGREPGLGLEQVGVIEARLAELAPHWLPATGE
ncbi:hypothetical protein L2D01_02995 [Hyphomonadaceae bacterium ML37]|nr:hypothetical protein L2D01_02995 [Hyphomonadaceae bacterium ML37]